VTRRVLGTVVRLQVQSSPLKPGVAPHRVYNPAPIVPVSRITVDPRGARGLLDDGTSVLDVHNADHPMTRDAKARAGLTLMTLADYERLRERFGPHVVDGCAGEVLLLDGVRPSDGEPVYVETVAGDLLPLADVRVAAPCVEFSRWCLRLPSVAADDPRVAATMEFLDHGGRGYRAVALGSATLAVGATVVVGEPAAVPPQRHAAGQPEAGSARR
jgi:hypothetical protein